MTIPIKRFLHRTGCHLVIEKNPCFKPLISPKYIATIRREGSFAEYKDDEADHNLTTYAGFGKTQKQATERLIDSLRGKLMILNAMSKSRKEYSVPLDLAL